MSVRKENNLNIQELSTNEAFHSEAAAKHRCFDHAKLVIDTNAHTTH